MVEHYVRDVGAAGSNPVTSTSEIARSFGTFPGLRAFVMYSKKTARRALLGHEAIKKAIQKTIDYSKKTATGIYPVTVFFMPV